LLAHLAYTCIAQSTQNVQLVLSVKVPAKGVVPPP
jgi:hypothetical protein